MKNKAQKVWYSMKERVSNRYKQSKPAYADVMMAEDLEVFENFKQFFDLNYLPNTELDKDILVPGNKVYSETTCVLYLEN